MYKVKVGPPDYETKTLSVCILVSLHKFKLDVKIISVNFYMSESKYQFCSLDPAFEVKCLNFFKRYEEPLEYVLENHFQLSVFFNSETNLQHPCPIF